MASGATTPRLGRVAATVALVSASAHLTLSAQAFARSPETSALLVLMAVGCLPCVPALWRGADVRAWLMMLGLTGAMLYAHLEFCFDCGPAVHVNAAEAGLVHHLHGHGPGAVAVWLMLLELGLAASAVLTALNRSFLTPVALVGGATQHRRYAP